MELDCLKAFQCPDVERSVHNTCPEHSLIKTNQGRYGYVFEGFIKALCMSDQTLA